MNLLTIKTFNILFTYEKYKPKFVILRPLIENHTRRFWGLNTALIRIIADKLVIRLPGIIKSI